MTESTDADATGRTGALEADAYVAVGELADAIGPNTYHGDRVGEARNHLLQALKRVTEEDETESEAVDRVRSALEHLSDLGPLSLEERRIHVRDALADLAPVAAGLTSIEGVEADIADTGISADTDGPGAIAKTLATLDEDDRSPDLDLDSELDLGSATNPLAELLWVADSKDPLWTVDVVMDIDAEIATQYRPALEQSLEASELDLYELLYNYGELDISVTIDGYDPEHFFETCPE
jgi:hypothetical protein